MLACALKSWKFSEGAEMTLGDIGTEHGGETLPDTFLFQSENLLLVSSLYLVSLKILFEEKLQRLVFLFFWFFFFFGLVFLENTCLDTIVLGKLIKMLKCKEVIFSNLYIWLKWDGEFFGETIKETQGVSNSRYSYTVLYILNVYNFVQKKAKLLTWRVFFFLLKVENYIQNYKSILKALNIYFFVQK